MLDWQVPKCAIGRANSCWTSCSSTLCMCRFELVITRALGFECEVVKGASRPIAVLNIGTSLENAKRWGLPIEKNTQIPVIITIRYNVDKILGFCLWKRSKVL